MSLVTKPDFNLIFASQAPSVDLPPQFNNYVRGMDETRKNNGKPTIKQFNYLHQNLDLKLLWILQNGAALPYDSSIEYAENSLAVKDGELQQFVGGVWSPFKKTVDASDVKDESGLSQQEWNNGVESIIDLLAIENPKNGSRVFVKSFHSNRNIGGCDFKYNSARKSINDSCMCFNGWERIGITEYDATLCGALADGVGSKLADLYTSEQYTKLYPNFMDTNASIDTIAIRALFKYVSDQKKISSISSAFAGSCVAHIKPVGKYILDAPVNMQSVTEINAYNSMIIKKSGYNGVLFYNTYPYNVDWCGGVYESTDENSGAVWWLGAVMDTIFNVDMSKLIFRNFEATRFKDVFAKFNNQSAKGVIEDFRISKVQNILGRGTILDVNTGLYQKFAPVDFSTKTNFRTPDNLSIRTGWVSAGAYFSEDLDALFYVGATAKFEDIMIIPASRTSGFDVAVVNSKGRAMFENVRGGGETGSFALINFFGSNTSAYPYEESIIKIDGSEFTGLNNISGITYTLAEAITANGATTLKLNRTDGLPDKGILSLGQKYVYTSVDRGTNTLTLESPIVASYAAGTSVVNQTPRCVIRLINGSPNLISIKGSWHGTDMGQIVGYSQFSNISAIEAQFKNTVLDINGNATAAIAYSGFLFPPCLYEVDADRLNSIFYKMSANKFTKTFDAVSSVSWTPLRFSLFETATFNIKLKLSSGDVGHYKLYVSCGKIGDNISYSAKLDALNEATVKITSISITRCQTNYGNSFRTLPFASGHKWNYGAEYVFTLSGEASGYMEMIVD